jgi:phage recombination protein Bet
LSDIIENPRPTTKRSLTDHIKKTIAPTATDEEFLTFVHIFRKYDLDPLLKEIYFMKYGNNKPPITMVSRDGFLKIAHANPMFDGMQGDVIYKGDTISHREDGSIAITYGDAHYLYNKIDIVGAFANVFRKDQKRCTAMSVSFKDYYKETTIWNQYPNAMILKVAEAMALKRAFGVSGMVSKEEMDATLEE